jgi:hypothetical protein
MIAPRWSLAAAIRPDHGVSSTGRGGTARFVRQLPNGARAGVSVVLCSLEVKERR